MSDGARHSAEQRRRSAPRAGRRWTNERLSPAGYRACRATRLSRSHALRRPGSSGCSPRRLLRASPRRPGPRLARAAERAGALAAARGVGLQPLAALRRGRACTACSASRASSSGSSCATTAARSRSSPRAAAGASPRGSPRALVAPRAARVSAATRARSCGRAPLRTITQGHLAQHVFFHSLHQFAIPSAAPDIFGVTDARFRALRRAGAEPAGDRPPARPLPGRGRGAGDRRPARARRRRRARRRDDARAGATACCAASSASCRAGSTRRATTARRRPTAARSSQRPARLRLEPGDLRRRALRRLRGLPPEAAARDQARRDRGPARGPADRATRARQPHARRRPDRSRARSRPTTRRSPATAPGRATSPRPATRTSPSATAGSGVLLRPAARRDDRASTSRGARRCRTRSPAYNPAISADGSRVAYQAVRDGRTSDPRRATCRGPRAAVVAGARVGGAALRRPLRAGAVGRRVDARVHAGRAARRRSARRGVSEVLVRDLATGATLSPAAPTAGRRPADGLSADPRSRPTAASSRSPRRRAPRRGAGARSALFVRDLDAGRTIRIPSRRRRGRSTRSSRAAARASRSPSRAGRRARGAWRGRAATGARRRSSAAPRRRRRVGDGAVGGRRRSPPTDGASRSPRRPRTSIRAQGDGPRAIFVRDRAARDDARSSATRHAPTRCGR